MSSQQTMWLCAAFPVAAPVYEEFDSKPAEWRVIVLPCPPSAFRPGVDKPFCPGTVAGIANSFKARTGALVSSKYLSWAWGGGQGLSSEKLHKGVWAFSANSPDVPAQLKGKQLFCTVWPFVDGKAVGVPAPKSGKSPSASGESKPKSAAPAGVSSAAGKVSSAPSAAKPSKGSLPKPSAPPAKSKPAPSGSPPEWNGSGEVAAALAKAQAAKEAREASQPIAE